MTTMQTDLVAARARWRSAEDRLYPTLITNPATYQRALRDIHALVEVLRGRGGDPSVLLAAEANPAELVASACPQGCRLPADLLVGVACRMRDRELTAAAERHRVDSVLAEARAAGRSWAVLTGPADPAELAEGVSVAVHLPSSTELTAGVDPWSGAPPFRLRVAGADGRSEEHEFTDRAQWLAAHLAARAQLDRELDRDQP